MSNEVEVMDAVASQNYQADYAAAVRACLHLTNYR